MQQELEISDPEYTSAVSYIKTQDSIFLQYHTSGSTSHSYVLTTEGFGTDTCQLVKTNTTPLFNQVWQVQFIIDSVCSVHSLPEHNTQPSSKMTKRAVLYGNALRLKHAHSDKYLSCQGNVCENDNLAYKIQLQQHKDESCWFIILPGQVTRSEGEKVRAGDDILLKSLEHQRYLLADIDTEKNTTFANRKPSLMIEIPDLWSSPQSTTINVIASFTKFIWGIYLFSSRTARDLDYSYTCGHDPVQFFSRHISSYLVALPTNTYLVYNNNNNNNNNIDSTINSATKINDNDGNDDDANTADGYAKNTHRICFQPIYQMNKAYSIWRIELLQLKCGGFFLQWGQHFRLRHLITGKFLGVMEQAEAQDTSDYLTIPSNVRDQTFQCADENQTANKKRLILTLFKENESNLENSIFSMRKSVSETLKWDQPKEDTQQKPQIKLGDSIGFIQHVRLSSNELSQKGKYKEDPADKQKLEDLWVGFTSGSMQNSYLQQNTGNNAILISEGVNLKYGLMICSISPDKAKGATNVCITNSLVNQFSEYSSTASKDPATEISLIGERLKNILDEFSKDSSNSAKGDSYDSHGTNSEIFQNLGLLTSFLGLANDVHSLYEIFRSNSEKQLRKHTRLTHKPKSKKAVIHGIKKALLDTLALFLKCNPECCRLFSNSKHLELFINMLDDQEFNRQVLDVLHNAVKGNADILHSFGDNDIANIIKMFHLFGRNEKTIELLSDLCICNDTAIRKNQKKICDDLLDNRDLRNLLLKCQSIPTVHVVRSNLCIGKKEGSATYQRWYYEVEVVNVGNCQNNYQHFRVGWISFDHFSNYPNYDSTRSECNGNYSIGISPNIAAGGIGDDMYSYGFDGKNCWSDGRAFDLLDNNAYDELDDYTNIYVRNGSVIGCYIDLTRDKIHCNFSLNGKILDSTEIIGFSSSLTLCPAISFTGSVTCKFRFGKNMGRFIYPPPSEFVELSEARSPPTKSRDEPEDYKQLFNFISQNYQPEIDSVNDLPSEYTLNGPPSANDSSSFVPAPIDVLGIQLPKQFKQLTHKIAKYLHDVWAYGKINDGFIYGAERDRDKKLHPDLIPYDKMTDNQKKYDLNTADNTLKTLKCLGYDLIRSESTVKEKYIDPKKYTLSNGYIPSIYDLDVLSEVPALNSMIDRLAENSHNIWAQEKISKGFTYGLSGGDKFDDNLLPYELLTEKVKESNRDGVKGVIEALIANSYSIISMKANNEILTLARNVDLTKIKSITYCVQSNYGVNTKLWRFDVKLETAGLMRIGWARKGFPPGNLLGNDEYSYAYDGYLARKWNKVSSAFGQRWVAGDIISCMLNFETNSISFARNNRLLRGDKHTNEAAFEVVKGQTYFPAISLSSGQKVKLLFNGPAKYLPNTNIPDFPGECKFIYEGTSTKIPLWYSINSQHYQCVDMEYSRFIANPIVSPKNKLIYFSLHLKEKPSTAYSPECIRLNIGINVGINSSTPEKSDVKSRNVMFGCKVKTSALKNTYLGWTTSSFTFIRDQFPPVNSNEIGQQCKLEGKHDVTLHTAYMMRLYDLLRTYQQSDIDIEFYCDINLDTGLITFSESKDHPIQQLQLLSQQAMLYPTIITTPCENYLFDFLFEPFPGYSFLSEQILKLDLSSTTSYKSHEWLPMMKLQAAEIYSWSYLDSSSMQYTISKDETCALNFEYNEHDQGDKYPTSYSEMYVLIPEEEKLIKFINISAYPQIVNFLTQSFRLFNSVCSGVFKSASEVVEVHINNKQLIELILLSVKFSIPSQLKQAIYSLFIRLNFEQKANYRLNTRYEYIIESKPVPKANEETNSDHRARTLVRNETIDSVDISSQESCIRLEDFNMLRDFLFKKLSQVMKKVEYNCRSINNTEKVALFVPELNILRHYLLVDMLDDTCIRKLLNIFYSNAEEGNSVGLLMIEELEESIKLEVCIILDYMLDLQLRERITEIVEFSNEMAMELKNDQAIKYEKINKELSHSSTNSMYKSKPFRLKPLAQMEYIFDIQNNGTNGKEKNKKNRLKEKIDTFDERCKKFIGVQETNDRAIAESNTSIFTPLNNIIRETLPNWYKVDKINNPKLTCAIFNLLNRQSHEIEEFSRALEKTYILPLESDGKNYLNRDKVLDSLGYLKSLLHVRLSQDSIEHQSLKHCLKILSKSQLVFHHPELLCSLRIHEVVISIMRHLLEDSQSKNNNSKRLSQRREEEFTNSNTLKDNSISECCKYLCHIARFSFHSNVSKHSNSFVQKMLFPYLDYLLELSGIYKTQRRVNKSNNDKTDTSPLEVANAIIRNNEHLALSLEERQIRNTIELLRNAQTFDSLGEEYLEFLKNAVCANDCYIEENAKVIITLLISNQECFGPALKDPKGFSSYFLEDSMIENYPIAEMDFSISLLELLAKCAPISKMDGNPNSKKKNFDNDPICSVLRKVIPSKQLYNLLIHPLESASIYDIHMREQIERWTRFKSSILLFYESIYGENDFDEILENSALVDLTYSLCICKHDNNGVIIILLKYIVNSLFPFLHKCISTLANRPFEEGLGSRLLHATYWIACVPFPQVQRNSVTEFLKLLAKTLPPITMSSLISKIIIDLPQIPSYNRNIIYQMLESHFTKYTPYYSGGTLDSSNIATQFEQRLVLELCNHMLQHLLTVNCNKDSLPIKNYKSSINQLKNEQLYRCTVQVINALAPGAIIAESNIRDDYNNLILLPTSLIPDINHAILPSFSQDVSNIIEHEHMTRNSNLLNALEPYIGRWLESIHDEMNNQAHLTKLEHVLEKADSILHIFVNKLLSYSIDFLHVGKDGEREISNSIFLPKDHLQVVKSAFKLSFYRKETKAKVLGRLMKSINFIVTDFAVDLNSHLSLFNKTFSNSIVTIPFPLLAKHIQDKLIQGVFGFFSLIECLGYKLNIIKQGTISYDTGEESLDNKTLSLLVVKEFYSKIKLETEILQSDSSEIQKKMSATNLETIILPVMYNFFMAHKNYFLSEGNTLVYLCMASPFELVEVAKLFHFIIGHLSKDPTLFGVKRKNHTDVTSDDKPICPASEKEMLDLALEKLCGCLDPLASNISVGKTSLRRTSESHDRIESNDSMNALAYIESIIIIVTDSIMKGEPFIKEFTLKTILPVITILITHIGNVQAKIASTLKRNQNGLDEKLKYLFECLYDLSISVEIMADPDLLPVIGHCQCALLSAHHSYLLDEKTLHGDTKYVLLLRKADTAYQFEINSAEFLQFTHTVLPILSTYIKHCSDTKNDNAFGIPAPCKPKEDVDIIIHAIIRILLLNIKLDVEVPFELIYSLETLIPYCSVQIYSIDIALLLKEIRIITIQLWKEEQELIQKEAEKIFEEAEHRSLSKKFDALLRYLISTLMIVGKFLHSHRITDDLTLAKLGGERPFWDMVFIFNCCQSSHYIRQGMQSLIHTLLNENSYYYTDQLSRLSLRADISILMTVILQHPKKAYNERNNVLLYCMKSYLNIIESSLPYMEKREAIEFCKVEFTTNQNYDYVSQKLERKYTDFQSHIKLAYSRVPTLTEGYLLGTCVTSSQLKLNIMEIGKIKACIESIEYPKTSKSRWKTVLTQQKKRAIMRGLLNVPLFKFPDFRISNYFLESYQKYWLKNINKDAKFIEDLLNSNNNNNSITTTINKNTNITLTATTTTNNNSINNASVDENDNDTAQLSAEVNTSRMPITSIIEVFCNPDDLQCHNIKKLYSEYAYSLTQSCSFFMEDLENNDKSANLHKMEKHQLKLMEANTVKMVIVVIANCQGERPEKIEGEEFDMIHQTFRLGKCLLEGGPIKVQTKFLEVLQSGKIGTDFFNSVEKIINACPKLDRSTYERQCKVFGYGTDDLPAAIKDKEFTKDLFRFLQLLCEGHNEELQNYLRTQPDKPTTNNLVINTVDYLLSLQESIQNFFGQYSSPGKIDFQGQSNFKKVFEVVQQVFNTLTEYIQGPCQGNQLALSNSRLWDAISGFIYIFAKMQTKLYQEYETSMELLKDVLDVHADMIILLLSMLEGNAMIGPRAISVQIREALIESRQSLQETVNFCYRFINLNDMITSKAFQNYDLNKDGVVSKMEFETALHSQGIVDPTEIACLMKCADLNQDGVIDYMEFMDRFYNPCGKIGFNLSVLLTILLDQQVYSDNNPEIAALRKDTEKLLNPFKDRLGCIEIIGKSKKVEKVFFKIEKENMQQWRKPQIQDSKHAFLKNLDHEGIFMKEKMNRFMDFCEDTIFEMREARETKDFEMENRAKMHQSNQNEYFKHVPTSPIDKIAINYKSIMNTEVSHWEKKKNAVIQFYDKLGIFKYIIKFILLLFGVFAIYKLFSRFNRDKPTSRNSKYTKINNNSDQIYGNSYVPKIINATKKLPFKPAIIDYWLKSTILLVVICLNFMLLFLNNQDYYTYKNQTSPSSYVYNHEKSNLLYANINSVIIKLHVKSESVRVQFYKNDQVLVYTLSERNIVNLYSPEICQNIAINSFNNNKYANLTFPDTCQIYNISCSNKTTNGSLFQFCNADKLTNCDSSLHIVKHCSVINITLFEFIEATDHSLLLGLIKSFGTIHFILSVVLIYTYVRLKFPLMVFKAEKAVGNENGSGSDTDDGNGRPLFQQEWWNSLVTSSKTFPKYWDKQSNETESDEKVDESGGLSKLGSLLNHIDLKYTTWLFCKVVCKDYLFWIKLIYCTSSFFGVIYSPFIFCIHLLLDIYINFETLQTIVYSIYLNRVRLIMSILIMLVIQLLFAIVGLFLFVDNFGDNVSLVFIYLKIFTAIAGGDVLTSIPNQANADDDDEMPNSTKIVFAISYFFSIQLVLIAIIQGLIIDAFGEIRAKEEAAREAMQTKCFICGLSKEAFDQKEPLGFQKHTENNHYYPNYLFFLLHLMNKDQTEYTGQESYVYEMYRKRNFDFFPVGTCFSQQNTQTGSEY